MPTSLSLKVIEGSNAKFNQVKAPQKQAFNLKEAVALMLKGIANARKQQMSWEWIAEQIETTAQSNGNTVTINPASVRQYYFELTGKKKQKPGERPQKSSAVPQRQTKANGGQTSAQPSRDSEAERQKTGVTTPERLDRQAPRQATSHPTPAATSAPERKDSEPTVSEILDSIDKRQASTSPLPEKKQKFNRLKVTFDD